MHFANSLFLSCKRRECDDAAPTISGLGEIDASWSLASPAKSGAMWKGFQRPAKSSRDILRTQWELGLRIMLAAFRERKCHCCQSREALHYRPSWIWPLMGFRRTHKGEVARYESYALDCYGRAFMENSAISAPSESHTGHRTVISFGDFRLVPATRTLTHAGSPVRLGARALDVLIALVERAPQVVSANELFAIVGLTPT